jgi:CRP/FNR family transcriptional regulator, cyclic AMP receptor protein
MNAPPNAVERTEATQAAANAAKRSPHERLLALGLKPMGRATDFSEEIYGMMAKTPLFSGLDIEETRKLGAFMYVYEAPAGITIINEGESGDFMMLLIKGMVDVLRRNRYNYPSRIAVAHSGHALGEMSMFDGEPRLRHLGKQPYCGVDSRCATTGAV